MKYLRLLPHVVILSLMVAAGCGTLDISDDSIEQIAKAAEQAVRQGVPIVATALVPEANLAVPGIVGSVAGALALGAAYLVRLLLKGLQKRSTLPPTLP